MSNSTAEISTMGLDLRINNGRGRGLKNRRQPKGGACPSHDLGSLTSLTSGNSCSNCDFYRNQLLEKDKTIMELENKVKVVHELTNCAIGSGSGATSGSGSADKPERMVSLVGRQQPLVILGDPLNKYPVSAHPSPMPVTLLSTTSTLSSSTSTEGGGGSCSNAIPFLGQGQPRYFNPIVVSSELKDRLESRGGDFGVIKVQEIIDKVVERSPGRKGSKEFRAADNDCFKNLFLRLESLVEETAVRKPDAESYSSGSPSDETFISSTVGPSWNESISKTSKKSNVRSKPRNGAKVNKAVDVRPMLGDDYCNRKRSHSERELEISAAETLAPNQAACQTSPNLERMESVEEKKYCDRIIGFEPLNHNKHWKSIDPKDLNLSADVMSNCNLLPRISGPPRINIISYN